MSAATYCRVCACQTENPHRFRSFALQSAASDALLAMIHYVNAGVNRGDGLPQNVCPQCLRRLTVTRDFIFKVRDAQDVLTSMFPKNADLDPINIPQGPILNTDIKEEPKEHTVYMTKELHSSDQMANDSIDCVNDAVDGVEKNKSRGANYLLADGQNDKTKIKPHYEVKMEMPVEYSTSDEESDVNSDSKSDVSSDSTIDNEPLMEYEEVKIECSDIPNLISNSNIKDLSKYDKWKKYKVPKINLENKEFPVQKRDYKSKAKRTSVDRGDELPLYNNIPTVANWIDNEQPKLDIKKTAKRIKKEKINSLDQSAKREINKDTNSPSTSKEETNEPMFTHEPIVQIVTKAPRDTVKSDTSSEYSSSEDEEDGTFTLPFYNGLPTTLLDVPKKSGDATLPSWKDYFRCKRCKKNTKTLQELMDHSMQEHTSCMPFKCYKCSVSVISRKHFFQHMFKHDKNLKQCCEYCGESFVSISDATWHKETEHAVEKKSFQCRLCDTGFDTNGELKCHEDTFIIGSRGPYICDHCNQEFPIKFDLKTHMERHYPSKHICKICDKSFKSKYNLQQHHDVHTPTMHHICQVCGKGFKQKSHYKTHLLIHSDAKPYECDICKKRFKMQCQVRRHKQCHGPPLFKCETCSKAFRYQNCLKIHLRMHSNEKPYSCEMCNKKFANWSNFNTHMKRIHGQNMAKAKVTNIILP